MKAFLACLFLLFTAVSGLAQGVGIGTTDPSATLHVNGSFRIENSSAGANKVLTSDSNGTATWKAPTQASRLRSILVPISLFDFRGSTTLGSYGSILYLEYPGGGTYNTSAGLQVPADWNGTTSMTVTFYYCTTSTTGNVSVSALLSRRALNQDVSSAGVTTLYSGAVPSSQAASTLSQLSTTISVAALTNVKIFQIALQRNNDAANTNTGPFRLLGARIEYYD